MQAFRNLFFPACFSLVVSIGSCWCKPLFDAVTKEEADSLFQGAEEDVYVEEDQDVQRRQRSFLEGMKEEFLRKLNLPGVPQEHSKIDPPQFMIELYNRYATNKSSMPRSDVIRSFLLQDVSHSETNDDTSKYRLLFNISIPVQEEVTMAELRLFTLLDERSKVSGEVLATIKIYAVEYGVVGPALRFLSGEDAAGTRPWEAFDITDAVQGWVRSVRGANELEVHVERRGCRGLDVSLSLKGNSSAALIVFSDDLGSRKREANKELRDTLAHEEEGGVFSGTDVPTDSDDSIPANVQAGILAEVHLRRRRQARSDYCRKTSLHVNFKDIGWDKWIVAPLEYDAFECRGVCYFPLTDDLTPSRHAVIQALVNLRNPKKANMVCCVPTKLDPITVLRIDHVLGEGMAENIGPLLLGAIWDRVVLTSSLILDLRFSASGEMSGIPYIASYLTDATPTIHLDTIYDRPSNTTQELWTRSTVFGERYGKRKDVIVLTSKGTMGAAEGLAYALKHLRRAIVVGERSAGGSVKIEKLKIGKSDFYITIPVARSISPVTGRSWEVGGVLPCVHVQAKEAIARAKSLIEVRRVFPKAVQSVSNIIKSFYSFTDRVPALLHHLSSIDFFSIMSEEDLAAKLNDELQTVSEDPRLTVKVMTEPPVSIEETSEPRKSHGDASFFEALVDNSFQVKVLPGNTGYLRFDEFVEDFMLVRLGEQIVREVWDLIKDTDNLIIDLRFNMGGPLAAVPILLSYLHDLTPAVHFFTIYDRIHNTTTEFRTLPGLLGVPYGSRRGIYVLTSRHTATAGEEFAYIMQSLRRATVIGEITSGTLLHSKTFQVKDTNIITTVPFINFIDNNGECWLGGGVVPDAIILAEEALAQAHRVIEFHQKVHSLVEGTGQTLEVHYAFPEVAAKVREFLRSKWAEGLYRSVVDYESLASQLTADLQETTGDHRLRIFYCDVEPEALQEELKIPTPEEVQYVVDALFRVEILSGNVGYLRFDMMADVDVVRAVGPQLLDLVWNKLVSTDALIIDMRYNTGGYTTAIPLLCTYFFDTEPLRHLYTVFDRSTTTMTDVMTLPEVLGQRYGSQKDMYILTSHMTGSAAETFTRTMKDLNRALVIGEPTIGGSLSSGIYQIGGSILFASIPNQVVLSAMTGKVWSVSGVEPNIVAQANDALNVAQKIIRARISKQDA